MAIKTLAADDNSVTLMMVGKFISVVNDKQMPDKAVDGAKAFEKWKEAFDKNEPYAVVFTDNQMPGGDGIDLIKNIRAYERQHGVKDGKGVLIAMNSGDGHKQEEARKAGADDFIIKGAVNGKTDNGKPDKGVIMSVFEKFKTILADRELEQTLAKAKANEEVFNRIPPPKRQGSTLKADFFRGHKRAKSDNNISAPISPPDTPINETKSFDFSQKSPINSLDTSNKKVESPQPQRPSYFEVMTPPSSPDDSKQSRSDYFQLNEPTVTSQELHGEKLIAEMKSVYTEIRNGKTMPQDNKVVASIVEGFHATNDQRLSDGQSKLSVREYFEDKYKERKEIPTPEDAKVSKPAPPTRKRSNSH